MRKRWPLGSYVPPLLRWGGRAIAVAAATIVMLAVARSLGLHPVAGGDALLLHPALTYGSVALLCFVLGIWAGSGFRALFETEEDRIAEARSLGADMLALSRSVPGGHFSKERWLPRYLAEGDALLRRAHELGLGVPEASGPLPPTDDERHRWTERYIEVVGPLLAEARIAAAQEAAFDIASELGWDREA